MGTCFEDAVYTDWIGDGYCDDGAYVPSDYGYGGPVGVAIWLNCDQFNCDGGDCECDGGGGCPAGEIEDCNGNCCPESWVGDGYCDDGSYVWNGIPIYLNCAEFNCDGGDCECNPDPIGACCFGSDCFEIVETECSSNGGEWQGDNTTCASQPCGAPCPADTDDSGTVDVSDILYVVGNWGSDDAAADVNGDGIVNVSDILEVVSAWGPCP
jgi:hypothetical protein